VAFQIALHTMGSDFALPSVSLTVQPGRILDRQVEGNSSPTNVPVQKEGSTMHRIRWQQHWAVIRRHRLFVILILVLGPLIGQSTNEDRGFLFGWLVSILAVIWLWGEGRP
jgi:hypothetical protein